MKRLCFTGLWRSAIFLGRKFCLKPSCNFVAIHEETYANSYSSLRAVLFVGDPAGLCRGSESFDPFRIGTSCSAADSILRKAAAELRSQSGPDRSEGHVSFERKRLPALPDPDRSGPEPDKTFRQTGRRCKKGRGRVGAPDEAGRGQSASDHIGKGRT